MFFKMKKKHKCEHAYEEIGRYYEEVISECYNGADFITGHVVKKCSTCGEICDLSVYQKAIYANRRSDYKYDKSYVISKLKENSFIEKTEYDMKMLS